MAEAVRRLGERLGEVRRQEDQARRRTAYDAAIVERDALAAELAEIYPPLAAQLADIVGRIAANDRLTRDLRLPAFHFGSTEAAYLWPAPERPLASLNVSLPCGMT